MRSRGQDATETPATVGRRYRLERYLGREGAAKRYHGADLRSGRAVIAWSLQLDEDAEEREELLALARALTRTSAPHLLRIIDIVPEARGLTVVLEATSEVLPHGSPADAIEDVRRAGTAVVALMRAGLAPERLPVEYVVFDGKDTRLDPIGILLPDRSGQPLPRPTDLLAGLLDAFLDGLAARNLTDTSAERIDTFLERWAPDRDHDDLPAFLRGLRELPVTALTSLSDTSSIEVVPREASAAPAPVAEIEAAVALDEGPGDYYVASFDPVPSPPVAAPTHRSRWQPPRRAVAVPAIAAVVALVLAAAGLILGPDSPTEQAARPPGTGTPAPVQPAAGRVTVGLTAQVDSAVRVTVDGVVDFEGTLRAGESQLWEGGERIQVWTDSGRTLLLTVNGHELGPYSPAMGHPDWNRIDFGFWPGWAP